MKIFGVGFNYPEHAKEVGKSVPETPQIFPKASSSVIGNDEPIILPKLSNFVDYEGELAVVIGSSAKNIKKEDAYDYVKGYTVGNDVTARDFVAKGDHYSFFFSKSFDTFCPLGPRTVSKDDIADPHSLNLSLRVNGETRQDSNTRNMHFKIPELISWITHRITLHPGDVILTGTPSGIGSKLNPPVSLKAGDVIEVEIEGIGILKNPVALEKE